MIRSFFAMAWATLAVSVVALLKETVIANTFGAGWELDAFLLSFSIILFFPMLLASTFQGTFAPSFCETLRIEPQRGWVLASVTLNVLSMVMAIFIFLMLLIGVFLISLLAPGFGESSKALALSLLLVLLPTLILTGINEQLKNTLNAMKFFAIPSISQSLPSFITIATILVEGKKWGIYAFAFGWDAGALVQTIVLAWYFKAKGGSYSLISDPRFQEFKKLVRLSAPYLIVPFSLNIIFFIDKYFASLMGTGIISYFNYAEKLFRVPWMIIAAALFTTALPFFSEQAADRDFDRLKETISLTVRLAAFLTIPIVIGMSILSSPLVSILFERGAFTATDTSYTALVLVGFMVSLFFYEVIFILDRGLCSLGGTRVLMKFALVSLFLKVFFAWTMTRAWGLSGLAFSTVPVLVFQSIGMYLAVRKRVGDLNLSNLLISFFKTLLASSGMAAVVLAIWHNGNFFFPGISSSHHGAFTFAFSIIFGIFIYWFISLKMKSYEAKALLQILGTRGKLKGLNNV